MKNKTLFIIVIIFTYICFFIFLKSLNNPNTYIPNESVGKKILPFSANTLLDKKSISSDVLFSEDKIYLLNIFASWCAPCRAEHENLMKLSKNSSIKIIGLNYRDSFTNAKKFIDQFGNPYSEIIVDKDGTIAINLGAIGVPETYVIDKNQKILRKFLGPINSDFIKDVEGLTIQ